jgi:hypothetical protein
MSDKAIYTQEQMDIALIKNTNEGILRNISEMKSDIKSNFHWTMGLILGLYAMGLTGLIGALGHAYGWF